MKVILTLILGVFSISLCADFNTALGFYEKKQYNKAFEAFHKMAQLGEKRSQFNLGVMYFQGQYVEKNVNKAYAWTRLATETELADPQQKKIHKIIVKKVRDMELADAEYASLSKKYNTEVLMQRLYPELLADNVNKKGQFKVKPSVLAKPRFPRVAALNGTQGWVRVRFDIDKKGNPRNIRVVEAFPDETFTNEVLRSIGKSQFEPQKDDEGKPVVALDAGYTFEFKFQDSQIVVEKSIYNETKRKAELGDASSQFLLGYWHEKLRDMEKLVNPTEMYLKAAVQGYSIAQYKLGYSLINGQGCIRDKEKGISWVTRAAANGQLDAQELLAGLALQSPTLESQQLALSYLNRLEKEDGLNPSATIRLAWLLATSSFADVADPKRAIELIEDITWKNYRDNVTKQEIIAASYAALGDFSEAVDYQDDALDDAKSLDYDISEIEQRLQAYKSNRVWF